jgi:hypothetical protein
MKNFEVEPTSSLSYFDWRKFFLGDRYNRRLITTSVRLRRDLSCTLAVVLQIKTIN